MDHARRDEIIGWVLVAVQAVLIAAVILLPRDAAWDGPGWLEAAAWAAIAIAAVLGTWSALHLGTGLTPLPLPNGAVDLVTRGPYRWIRHPIYTAVSLGVGAIAIRTRTPMVIATAAALILFLAFKARWEERHLMRVFPGYEDYAARTGRFVPLLGRIA
jgi:protein-S-isoprenylcysteine O-methyltransferase Ste14